MSVIEGRMRGFWMLDTPSQRDLTFPLTAEQLRPLDSRCERVQFRDDRWSFGRPPTESDFTRLAAFLRSYPGVALRVYGDGESVADLGFLRHFPFLEHFQCDLYLLEGVEGFRHLPASLKSLSLGLTKRKLSLRFLEQFPHLIDLAIEGHSRDFEVIGSLTKLQWLLIRSVTVPSLGPLVGLPDLWWLAIKLGGTRNLEALRKLTRLKYLELWMIRGLENIEPVSDMTGLQYLFLEDLARIKRLPSFARLKRLRRLCVYNLRDLRDVSSLREATSLEELSIGSRGLGPADFEVLRGHPSLRSSSIGTGSRNRDKEIELMIGLPSFTRMKDDFDFR